MRCYSQAQGEGPLVFSQLNTATHIVLNIGPVSAFWASSHCKDACKPVSVCELLRIGNNGASLWLFDLALRFGASLWRFALALRFGASIWRFALTLRFGASLWRFDLALRFGASLWRFALALHFGASIWRFDLALRFGASIWRFDLAPWSAAGQTVRDRGCSHVEATRNRVASHLRRFATASLRTRVSLHSRRLASSERAPVLSSF